VTGLPSATVATHVDVEPADLTMTFTAMASAVTLRILDPGQQAIQAMESAREMFHTIERTCTRFDPESDLMRANANARRWTRVDPSCLVVLRQAFEAYRNTAGAFDPRTLESLRLLGYDRSWELMNTHGQSVPNIKVRRRAWRPSFDDARSRVRIGPRPVDLGGIGKGFAVASAMGILAAHGRSILVEAGGDLAVRGSGPNSAGWRVQIESPFGGDRPAAVWEVTDTAVATSSIRRHHWQVGGQQAHHLIDPRTGLPAQSGLLSVTAVHPDAATAEVWTKVGFLAGRSDIRTMFDQQGIPAVWVTEDARVGYSKAAAPLLAWKASRVRPRHESSRDMYRVTG